MADQEESFTFGNADYDECVKFREFQQRLKDVTDAQQQEKQQHKKKKNKKIINNNNNKINNNNNKWGSPPLHRSRIWRPMPAGTQQARACDSPFRSRSGCAPHVYMFRHFVSVSFSAIVQICSLIPDARRLTSRAELARKNCQGEVREGEVETTIFASVFCITLWRFYRHFETEKHHISFHMF